MKVLRWPTKMPDGGLLPDGEAAYEHGKGKVSDPLGACEQTIHISLFFDGTNNNDDRDNKEFRDSRWQAHTNVARLYNAAHDKPDSGVFAHYIAGVGTIFEKLGELGYSSAGKAFARGYGPRCVWGYTRVLNSIYKAIAGAETILIENDEAKDLCHATADGYRRFATLFDKKHRDLAGKQRDRQRDCQRNKMVKQVWINVFGFSRGAACARSFIGKLTRDWAPGGKIAGAIPYQVNFMGLFDTVASVGPPDSVRAAFEIDVFDGHFAWASNGLMNIPKTVKRCVHFFSIHEQRMSFPLDTIREGSAYPGGAGQRLEVAYPGVHSDLGGGYPPGAQGKSRGGDADKLSQIPLHHMYIEALRWGVPLMMEEDIIRSQGERHDFILSAPLIDAFNAWLDRTTEISSVEDAMRFGMRQSVAWRALRARWRKGDYIANTPFFRAAQEDPLTPHQLKQRVDEAVEGDAETLKLRQRIKALSAGVSTTGLANAAQGYVSAAQHASQMKQAAERERQMQATWDALARRREQLCQEIAKKTDKTRPGEDADETVTNDQHDLREAAEEFRLLLGYLHPSLRAELGVEDSPFSARPPAISAASLFGPLGITLAALNNTGRFLCVRREKNPDSEQILLVNRDAHVQTAAATGKHLQVYDVLVVPARAMVATLQEWTSPTAVDRFAQQERASIALFDDYIHDSRAWFRVPNFHEYAPGGFGWARTFYVGNDNAIRHLGLEEDARAAAQAARTEALVRSINSGPTPTLDEMLMGD
ncbi:T6SS phospholipase effector Tle1-like catalytic domain-containing protein [Ralstonia wenshanensis]|uniref:T6SS Phospholipase effector Tle1-like catalytic domain-containing protein n=1 Tax=Ralstonia wenshanensis TaxID=2842456 RepID=A0AAD2B739_9RALS|nr:DUF2235 domain-containing protein [Ralstonia wenshanensis]CAJ0704109.1 hypothetical protein LMG18091_04100 [Ralstonia wenshanensis]